MAISNTDSKVVYNGNGATTVFPFTFALLDVAHMKVILTDDKKVEQVLTSDYLVDITNKTVTYPGWVSGQEPPVANRPPVLPLGWKITLLRSVPATQETDLGDRWPFKEIEAMVDKLTMVVQQLSEVSGRALVAPASVVGVSTELPAPEADKLIGWNANGTALVNTISTPGQLINEAIKLAQDAEALAVKAMAIIDQTRILDGGDAASTYALTLFDGGDAANG